MGSLVKRRHSVASNQVFGRDDNEIGRDIGADEVVCLNSSA